jgi:hypothetical protein
MATQGRKADGEIWNQGRTKNSSSKGRIVDSSAMHGMEPKSGNVEITVLIYSIQLLF